MNINMKRRTHMKKYLPVVLVVALLVLALPSSALAGPWDDPVGCKRVGGEWIDEGDGTFTCYFDGSHDFAKWSCPQRYDLDYTFEYGDPWGIGWVWWFPTDVHCALSTSQEASEAAVTSGTPLDAWLGNCGVYISNPPVNGSIMLDKVHTSSLSGPNMKGICSVKYYDFLGTELSSFGSTGWVYYNLDKLTFKLYEEGKLNFYVRPAGMWWQTCDPVMFDHGEYGRLACFVTDPVQWGIGTSLESKPGKLTPLWGPF
jgi:hypothetical protein